VFVHVAPGRQRRRGDLAGELHQPPVGADHPHLVAGREGEFRYRECYRPDRQLSRLAAVLQGAYVGLFLYLQVDDLQDLGADGEHGLGLSA
jgi:hypothetical protein